MPKIQIVSPPDCNRRWTIAEILALIVPREDYPPVGDNCPPPKRRSSEEIRKDQARRTAIARQARQEKREEPKMRIKEVEFGFLKNLGNYENQRVSYRAELEDWETPEDCIDILRNRAAEELGLTDAWKNFAEFLTAHGVDPEKLTIENFVATRSDHSYQPPVRSDLEVMQDMYEIAIADDDEDAYYGEDEEDEY